MPRLCLGMLIQPRVDGHANSLQPCQALFVAPCAHVWHYKCIRPLLEGKNSTYPQFQCPNCRAYSDLTADVDIAQSDIDEWMENADEADGLPANAGGGDASTHEHATEQAPGETDTTDTSGALDTSDASDEAPENPSVTVSNPVDIPRTDGPSTPRRASGLLARRQATNPSPELNTMNGNIAMPDQPDEDEMNAHLEHQRTRTQTPDPEQIIAGEGPLTPRNNAGPFVFDGSAGRSDARALVVPGIPEVANENGTTTL